MVLQGSNDGGLILSQAFGKPLQLCQPALLRPHHPLLKLFGSPLLDDLLKASGQDSRPFDLRICSAQLFHEARFFGCQLLLILQ